LKGTLLLRPTAAHARLDIYTKQETTPKEQDVQQQEHRNRDDGVSVLMMIAFIISLGEIL